MIDLVILVAVFSIFIFLLWLAARQHRHNWIRHITSQEQLIQCSIDISRGPWKCTRCRKIRQYLTVQEQYDGI